MALKFELRVELVVHLYRGDVPECFFLVFGFSVFGFYRKRPASLSFFLVNKAERI